MVLVGGSTRTPLVTELLEERLGQPAHQEVNPDLCVAMGASVQAAIIELLGRLRNEMGLSLLFITHDLALIRTIADNVIVMNQGRIVETGAVQQIFTAPSADYTRELLANTPSIEVALGHVTAPAG